MKPDIKRYCQQQCHAYRDQSSGVCEISALLRRCPHFRQWEIGNHVGGLEVHHIWKRMGMESHSFCCLILVSNAAHSWCHDSGYPRYNVGHAFEAVSLFAKWEMFRTTPRLNGVPDDQLHWNTECLDAARSVCVSHKTLASRVEFLADSLAGSVWQDVTDQLMEIVR